MDDKSAGLVVGKGFSDIYIVTMGISTAVQMWYTIKIQSKDERYKYEIYDIYFKSYPGQYGTTTTKAEDMFDEKNYYKKPGQLRSIQEKYKIETETKVNSLITTLKASMSKALTSTNSGDDW